MVVTLHLKKIVFRGVNHLHIQWILTNPLFCVLCPHITDSKMICCFWQILNLVYWRRIFLTICFFCVVYLVTVVSLCFCVFFDKERRGVFPRGGGGAKYTQKEPAINKRHTIKQHLFVEIETNYIKVQNHRYLSVLAV